MWKQEMPLHRELFDKLGSRVPAVMRQRFETLASALG
jgi:GTP-dependent phosphoenolpyruvate carboxykinase